MLNLDDPRAQNPEIGCLVQTPTQSPLSQVTQPLCGSVFIIHKMGIILLSHLNKLFKVLNDLLFVKVTE